MFILIPNKFFIQVKPVSKSTLDLYDNGFSYDYKKSFEDKKGKKNKKVKKGKKHKYRDSIIDYFRDMEEDNYYQDDSIDGYDDIYELEEDNEIDSDYLLESTYSDEDDKYEYEDEDLFLEIDTNDIKEV